MGNPPILLGLGILEAVGCVLSPIKNCGDSHHVVGDLNDKGRLDCNTHETIDAGALQ